jgi:hypothetical protein
MERLLRQAEDERQARIKQKEDEEIERKKAYDEFVRKQKEREEKYKIKSDISFEEARDIQQAKLREQQLEKEHREQQE